MRLVFTIGVTIVAVAVLAPLALADPATHPHDYLAEIQQQGVSSVPPDLRDHAEIKKLDAQYGNPYVQAASSTTGFSWGDAGIGAGATIGIVLLLGSAAVLTIRRRARLAL